MSVIGDILNVVKSRVETIQTASGYSFNVGTVSRATRRGDHPQDNDDVVIYHEAPEPNEELSLAGNPPYLAYDLPVKVVCYVRQTTAQGTTEPLSDIETNRYEDIAKSITSPAAWYKFGGNSINATLGPPTVEGGDDDGTNGSVVNLTITYRVSEVQPSAIGV